MIPPRVLGPPVPNPAYEPEAEHQPMESETILLDEEEEYDPQVGTLSCSYRSLPKNEAMMKPTPKARGAPAPKPRPIDKNDKKRTVSGKWRDDHDDEGAKRYKEEEWNEWRSGWSWSSKPWRSDDSDI